MHDLIKQLRDFQSSILERQAANTIERMLAVVEAARAFRRVVPSNCADWHDEHQKLWLALKALESA